MLTTMSIQIAAFSAGIVLLINVWGGRKRGLALDQDREMHDVWSCMNFLSVCEKTCVYFFVLFPVQRISPFPPTPPT